MAKKSGVKGCFVLQIRPKSAELVCMAEAKKTAHMDPFEEDELKYKDKPMVLDETILKDELNLSTHITGKVDTLRNTILSFIAEHRFDSAIRELKMYRNRKVEINEIYKYMSNDHYRKSIHFIRSMQSLLAGVELRTLPLAKRQDIYDKVVSLFESLKACLNNLGTVENDIKVRDLKSTISLLKITVACAFILAIFTAGVEALATMDRPVDVIINDVTTFIFSLFGT